MDDREEGLVQWLNLVKGVVDSVDVPLSISRETIQHNKIRRVINKNLVKKCLDMLPEAVEKKEISSSLANSWAHAWNLEIHESPTNRKKIAELLRVNTSKSGEAEIEFEGVCGSLEAREE